MTVKSTPLPAPAILPVTPTRWPDLARLFGDNGACGGCWCMWWRITNAEFNKQKGHSNREALKKIVASGQVPGLLAYIDNRPIGWCAIEPRKRFGRLERSPTLKRVDDTPVWSVVCFFVDKAFRSQGMTEKLLKAAVEYARSQGAQTIEGYPLDVGKSIPPPFAYTGLASTFLKVGFIEVARRSLTRPIMRYHIT